MKIKTPKKCNHNWIIDTTSSSLYNKHIFVCIKCSKLKEVKEKWMKKN